MTTELLTSAASDTAATAFAKAAAVKNLGERTSRPHCALARDHESRRRGRSPCGDWRPSRRTGLDGRPSAARRLSATLRARPLGGHENRLKRYTKTPALQASRNGVKCCHCCQSQFPVSNWQHLHIGFASASAVNPHFFASPAERAISCGPKGPFVSGGAAWPDRAQGRCNADGEAKPQAVRRRAFLEVAARRPAARRFSWSRASASLSCAQAHACLGGWRGATPGGSAVLPPNQHASTPGGISTPTPGGCKPRGHNKNKTNKE